MQLIIFRDNSNTVHQLLMLSLLNSSLTPGNPIRQPGFRRKGMLQIMLRFCFGFEENTSHQVPFSLSQFEANFIWLIYVSSDPQYVLW